MILTTFDLTSACTRRCGPAQAGFLLKDAQPADLLSAIRAVASGDAVVAPSITRRLLTPGGSPSHLLAGAECCTGKADASMVAAAMDAHTYTTPKLNKL